MIHAQEVLRQIQAADELIEVGRQMLALMQAAMVGSAEEQAVAKAALLLSSRNDGMASSADAAQKLIERGTLMKRRALGMEAKSGPPGEVVRGTPGVTMDAKKLMEAMPVGTLRDLRQFAQDGMRGRLNPPKRATTLDSLAVPDEEPAAP
jgi:hypothetical protein